MVHQIDGAINTLERMRDAAAGRPASWRYLFVV
jgi:hypothetical protein